MVRTIDEYTKTVLLIKLISMSSNLIVYVFTYSIVY